MNKWQRTSLKVFWEEQSCKPGLAPVAPDEGILSTKIINDFLFSNISFGDKEVLDLGCGIGRLIPAVFHNGTPKRYVGVDWSPTMLARARYVNSKYESKLEFVLADITKTLPFSERSFDKVIIWTVLVHVLDDSVFNKTLSQALQISREDILVCDPTCSENDMPYITPNYPTKKRRKSDYYNVADGMYKVSGQDLIFGSLNHPESKRTVFIYKRT